MNKFLFITHITPQSKRSAFRQALISIYFSALKNQTYADWKVIVIGEEEKVDGKFYYFRLEDDEGSRPKKFQAIKDLFLKPEVQILLNEADYIIKLDDDDIIAPGLLDQLCNFKDDLYYDNFHTFVDSSSGLITQQERPWVASTCVHKKEHILSAWNGTGSSPVGNLLYTDHSQAWHAYYNDKKKIAAPKGSPVYLRVLSPTSITSGALNGPPQSLKDVAMEDYYNYLKGFGSWKKAPVESFTIYLPELRKAWKEFSGADWKPIPQSTFFRKLLNRISGS